MDKFDKITNARKALFNTGYIKQVGNRMVAKKAEHADIAKAYDLLAEMHTKVKKKVIK